VLPLALTWHSPRLWTVPVSTLANYVLYTVMHEALHRCVYIMRVRVLAYVYVCMCMCGAVRPYQPWWCHVKMRSRACVCVASFHDTTGMCLWSTVG
jgi:hypothetical protein